MTCILLDVDGVLHVSGEAIPGAQDAVARLRAAGHTLRFVTNTSTRPRAQLTDELRELGFELSEDELQTTARTAARELAGKRVFALVMSDVVPDLEGLELVGEGAEAVLIGGCDETLEPNQVFSYMNLARAFAEIQLGADFYCLHKNRWWQTSRGPLLDAGAFVAGLEYATGVEATVLGKPSPTVLRRRARRARRGARADLARRRRRRVGRPRGPALRHAHGARPDREVPPRHARAARRHARRRAQLDRGPARLARARRLSRTPMAIRIGTDLIEIDRIRLALERPGLPRPLLHAGRAGVLRDAAEPGGVLCRAVLRQGGGRQGARVRRPLHVEGDRDRRAAEARRDALREDAPLRRARRDAGHRRLADPLAHDGRRRRASPTSTLRSGRAPADG